MFELISKHNENLFKEHVEFIYQRYLEILRTTINKKKEEEKLKSDFNFSLINFLAKKIIHNLNKSEITDLDFELLEPYKEGFKILLYILKNYSALRYLRLSGCLLTQKQLTDVYLAVYNKKNFELDLTSLEIDTDLLKLISSSIVDNPYLNVILDDDYKKKLEIINKKIYIKSNKNNKKKHY